MTRFLDILFSLFGLIVLSPLFLVLYVLIRMETGYRRQPAAT